MNGRARIEGLMHEAVDAAIDRMEPEDHGVALLAEIDDCEGCGCSIGRIGGYAHDLIADLAAERAAREKAEASAAEDFKLRAKAEAQAHSDADYIRVLEGRNGRLAERAEKAEGDRDRAINEAHAAREARRMTEAALETMKEQRDRARAKLLTLGWGLSAWCADKPPEPKP